MLWAEYGKHTEYGWEIDHAIPRVMGGLTVSWNLRARHWRGNAEAGGSPSGMGRVYGIRV
jgi:hypothetical protein